MRRVSSLLALVLVACGSGAPRDAGPDAPPFRCAPPLSIQLEVSPRQGIPVAGIAATDGACALHVDESRSDLLLLVADFDDTGLADGLLVATANRWVIASSSVPGASATYQADLPRDTDVDMVLEGRGGSRASMTFRVTGDVLTLLAMRVDPG